MNVIVARQDDSELEMQEWFFVLVCADNQLLFEFRQLKEWRRNDPSHDYVLTDSWIAIDALKKSTIKIRPIIPDDVLDEAKRWIMGRIIFKI